MDVGVCRDGNGRIVEQDYRRDDYGFRIVPDEKVIAIGARN